MSDNGIVDYEGEIDEISVVDSTIMHLLGELKSCSPIAIKHAIPRILEGIKEGIMKTLLDGDEIQEKLPFDVSGIEPLCGMFPSEWCSPEGCSDAKECLKL